MAKPDPREALAAAMEAAANREPAEPAADPAPKPGKPENPPAPKPAKKPETPAAAKPSDPDRPLHPLATIQDGLVWPDTGEPFAFDDDRCLAALGNAWPLIHDQAANRRTQPLTLTAVCAAAAVPLYGRIARPFDLVETSDPAEALSIMAILLGSPGSGKGAAHKAAEKLIAYPSLAEADPTSTSGYAPTPEAVIDPWRAGHISSGVRAVQMFYVEGPQPTGRPRPPRPRYRRRGLWLQENEASRIDRQERGGLAKILLPAWAGERLDSEASESQYQTVRPVDDYDLAVTICAQPSTAREIRTDTTGLRARFLALPAVPTPKQSLERPLVLSVRPVLRPPSAESRKATATRPASVWLDDLAGRDLALAQKAITDAQGYADGKIDLGQAPGWWPRVVLTWSGGLHTAWQLHRLAYALWLLSTSPGGPNIDDDGGLIITFDHLMLAAVIVQLSERTWQAWDGLLEAEKVKANEARDQAAARSDQRQDAIKAADLDGVYDRQLAGLKPMATEQLEAIRHDAEHAAKHGRCFTVGQLLTRVKGNGGEHALRKIRGTLKKQGIEGEAAANEIGWALLSPLNHSGAVIRLEQPPDDAGFHKPPTTDVWSFQ